MRDTPPNRILLSTGLVLAMTACSPGGGIEIPDASTPSQAAEIGSIASDSIREASGLAPSGWTDERLWVVNDGGWPSAIHAVGRDGADLGTTLVTNIDNVDWEDLGSFDLNGARYLLIADIGDNLATRDDVALHFVPEPGPAGAATTIATRTIRFRYPDGPRDAESIAVDAAEGAAYILSKRTIPAELYRVALTYTPAGEPVVAEYLGTVDSLPQPSREDVEQAPVKKDWGWQPTAMDFSADGKSAVLLTYRAVYTYPRADGESWYEALQSRPTEQSLGLYFGAESVALRGSNILVTFEALNPPLLQFPL